MVARSRGALEPEPRRSGSQGSDAGPQGSGDASPSSDDASPSSGHASPSSGHRGVRVYDRPGFFARHRTTLLLAGGSAMLVLVALALVRALTGSA